MINFQIVKSMAAFAIVTALCSCGGTTGSNPDSLTSSSSVSSVTANPPVGSSSAFNVSSPSISSVRPSSMSVNNSSKPSEMTDTQAPTAPSKLVAGTVSSTSVTLNWSQSTDNTGVTTYRIYRDSNLISTVTGNTQTLVDSSASPGKTYLYGVMAGDAAGNWSPLKTLTLSTTGVASSSVSKSSVASSSKASSAASSIAKSATATSAAQLTHNVSLSWEIPTQRMNGKTLNIQDIGGYSIRYTSQTDQSVALKDIPGGSSNSGTVEGLKGAYNFEIASYDTNGLYSSYETVGIK